MQLQLLMPLQQVTMLYLYHNTTIKPAFTVCIIEVIHIIIIGAFIHLHKSTSCLVIISLCINKTRLISIMFRVSPQGNSPWRTREAGQSSRTGCLPPPLSCTSHSDWDPCRISEMISDTSVSPSLISVGVKCKKNSPILCESSRCEATDAAAVTPSLPPPRVSPPALSR